MSKKSKVTNVTNVAGDSVTNTPFFNIRVAVTDIDKLYKSAIYCIVNYMKLKKMDDEYITKDDIHAHIHTYFNSVGMFYSDKSEFSESILDAVSTIIYALENIPETSASVKKLSQRFGKDNLHRETQHIVQGFHQFTKRGHSRHNSYALDANIHILVVQSELSFWIKTLDTSRFDEIRTRESIIELLANLQVISTVCTMYVVLGLKWKCIDKLCQLLELIIPIVQMNQQGSNLVYYMFHRGDQLFDDVYELLLESISDLNKFYDSIDVQVPAALPESITTKIITPKTITPETITPETITSEPETIIVEHTMNESSSESSLLSTKIPVKKQKKIIRKKTS